ncbi:hypothetical protein V493_00193 [Pseudogymnoascus sp. VKM F-4281 (FW-2241)]|nr:hypothetical protein V493_00193 [Pseudogymnoascus sp. VKM F-4281 (FW-2241)]
MSNKVDPADFKTYHGGCHCGAFKFAIRIPEMKYVMACNCSICIKNGILGNIWFKDEGPEEFIVEKGDIDALERYSFEPRKLVYRFCGVCGTNVFVKEPGQIGINARSLVDIDVEPLPRRYHEGWKKGTSYAPEFGQRVEWRKPEGKAEENTEDGLVTYYGNCHCGKMRETTRARLTSPRTATATFTQHAQRSKSMTPKELRQSTTSSQKTQRKLSAAFAALLSLSILGMRVWTCGR